MQFFFFPETKDTCWVSYLAASKSDVETGIQCIGEVIPGKHWEGNEKASWGRKAVTKEACYTMWINGNQLLWVTLGADAGHKPQSYPTRG